MAKAKQKNLQTLKSKKQRKEQSHLHFAMTSKNYMIIGAGILTIIIGYVFMSENSVSGFLPTVIAPILLIFGYCVLVPFGILYKDKGVDEKAVEEVREVKEETTTKRVTSSNVKTS